MSEEVSRNVSIPLAEPIEGHPEVPNGAPVKITALLIRRPRFSDIQEFGEPVSYAHSQAGLVYNSTDEAALSGYINRLCIEPKDTGLLSQLGCEDTLRLRETIKGFFRTAREAIFS